jgi:hypothetical protein
MQCSARQAKQKMKTSLQGLDIYFLNVFEEKRRRTQVLKKANHVENFRVGRSTLGLERKFALFHFTSQQWFHVLGKLKWLNA